MMGGQRRQEKGQGGSEGDGLIVYIELAYK